MTAKLATVVQAVQEELTADLLSGALWPSGQVPPEDLLLKSTRLAAPDCFWSVYVNESGSDVPSRLAARSFFDSAVFDRYSQAFLDQVPERVGDLLHPEGGIALLPELSTVVWGLPYDPSLPGLAHAMNPAVVAPLLGVPAEAIEIEVVRYRPEVDAMLRYLADGETLAYGKVASEERSAIAFAALTAVSGLQHAASSNLLIPEPLGTIPEAGLLLQRPVPGSPVAGNRMKPEFAEVLEVATGAVTAIHGSAVTLGRAYTLDDHVARLESTLDDFGYSALPLLLSMRKLLTHIKTRKQRLPVGKFVPSHGDFKYDQFLRDDGQYSLIDFETFCQAEAAFDVGSFCAYLPASLPADWEEAAVAEDLRGRFLEAYTEAAGGLDRRRAALYEAVSLGLRASSHVWIQRRGWRQRAGSMIDIAFERLVNP